MMRMFARRVTVICVVGLAAISPPTWASGGGDTFPPEFNSPWGPVRPVSDLATGSLGVVESSWWRKPLLLAWYRFNGQPVPLAALDAFEYKAQADAIDSVPTAMNAWLAEAKAIASVLAPERVAADAPSVTGNGWDTFENCPNAAWDQARRTLAERSRTWGTDSPALRDWLTVQHRVFARCPLGPAYFRSDLTGRAQANPAYAKQYVLQDMALPDPPADAPALLIKDRAYQRAAGLMYEGNYKEAEDALKRIAQDKTSPWQEWGTYLAFRARLRSIQVTAPSDDTRHPCQAPECIEQRANARASKATESRRLREDVARAIAAARSAKRLAEVKRLGDLDALIGARLEPAKRFAELAAVLMDAGVGATETRRAVTDYLLLHRQFRPSEPMGEWLAGLIDGYDPTNTPCRIDAGPPAPLSPSPALAESDCRRLQWSQESLRRFEQGPTQYAWLFSAAVLAHRDDPHVETLLAAMGKVPEDHPGSATFMLQRLRLGGREDALRLASALMKRPDITSDYSARNRVREYRFWHATSLMDICRDALREHGVAFDRDTLLQSQATDPKAEPAWGWDYDAAWVLNYELPHWALLEAARQTECPSSFRTVAASIAWSRAIVRKDVAGARQAGAVWSKGKGDGIPPAIARVLSTNDDRAYLLESGLMIEGARTGGTCRIATPRTGAVSDHMEAAGVPPFNPGHFAKSVLPPEHYEEWQRERQALDALPDLDSVWMQNVLAFAKAFPTDVRVPGLLRDAVYRTRMNWCAEPSAGKLSKAAFDLLKGKYPRSKEAVTTRYWFKPGT